MLASWCTGWGVCGGEGIVGRGAGIVPPVRMRVGEPNISDSSPFVSWLTSENNR